MSEQALQAIERGIAALTIEEIEATDIDASGQRTITQGRDVTLLNRSIGVDLGAIPSMRPDRARALLVATHLSIDEALLALEEARLVLVGAMR